MERGITFPMSACVVQPITMHCASWPIRADCACLKGKGSGVWPSMVIHTQNLCSAFNPSKCTHTVVNTHLEQWAANAAAPGEQLGVRCLAQGFHLSRGIEGGESAGYSLPPPTIPAGPETRTHDLRVTSPTLYPLGHDCPKEGQGGAL